MRPVEPHAIAQRAAEQLVDRHAERLRLDVPQRQLDAGDGLVRHAAPVLPRRRGACPSRAARRRADPGRSAGRPYRGRSRRCRTDCGCRCTRPSRPARRRSRSARTSTAASRRRNAAPPPRDLHRWVSSGRGSMHAPARLCQPMSPGGCPGTLDTLSVERRLCRGRPACGLGIRSVRGVSSGGVSIAWEVFGDGETTVLFIPPWQLVHSRIWKAQVADLLPATVAS